MNQATGLAFVHFVLKAHHMITQQATRENYRFLYRFLPVLDGSQIHKFYNIVAGLLDVSVFTKEEIDRLEKLLSPINMSDRYSRDYH